MDGPEGRGEEEVVHTCVWSGGLDGRGCGLEFLGLEGEIQMELLRIGGHCTTSV
jgi:hypothetical protein